MLFAKNVIKYNHSASKWNPLLVWIGFGCLDLNHCLWLSGFEPLFFVFRIWTIFADWVWSISFSWLDLTFGILARFNHWLLWSRCEPFVLLVNLNHSFLCWIFIIGLTGRMWTIRFVGYYETFNYFWLDFNYWHFWPDFHHKFWWLDVNHRFWVVYF